MPNTPAAAPAVSSTVGLKNMVIAPVTADTETATTYGDLQRVAGAIEATITPENNDPDIQFFDDVEGDVLYPDPELTFKTKLADLLRTSGENGSRACSWILQNAAQPVLEQMLHNASTDPKRRTGTLLRSIKIGRVVKKRSGGYRVTVGIHRKDGGAAYGNPVEFGHGGPHPAPPHPFVRPAFDAKADEAYEKVKEQLKEALDHRGLL